MKKTLLILAPLAILAACQNLEPASQEELAPGKKIDFSSSVGDYTKATDKSFEEGDIVGLSAADPVNASNVKLTYANGSFTPERTLYWGLDQKNDQKTSFVAYAPFDAAIDPAKAFSFTIKADQSANGAYAASDLLAAKVDAAPADGTVHLAFNHVLSRLVLSVENGVEGDDISGVTLGGVQLALTADIANGRYAATGDPTVVTPARKDIGYVFLVAPQKVIPEVLVAMKSGKTVRYTPDAELEFASGKQVSAAITVGKDEVKFEAEVLDWVDSEVRFGKTSDSGQSYDEWAVIGSIEGSDWNNPVPMTLQEDGSYYVRISNLATDYRYFSFHFINQYNGLQAGPATDQYYELVNGEPVEIPVSYQNNYWFYYYLKDILDVHFYPAKGLAVIEIAPYEWKSIGTGKFIDGFITDVFGLPHEDMDVEIETESLREGMYRIPNPYKDWSWTPYFNYTEGGELILNATNPDRVYFAETFTGISDDKYGDFYAMSLVQENGWSNYNYYGWYWENYKFIPFYDITATYLDKYGTLRSNGDGMMSVTLPDGSRPNQYTDISFSFTGTEVGDDGVNYAVFDVKPQMDVTTLRYGIWSGSLAREDVISDCIPALQNNAEGIVSIADFLADDYNTVKIPFNQSGSYTVVFYATNATGEYWNWRFDHVGMLLDGDTAPAAEIVVTVPEKQGAYSDTELTFHVDMKDPAEIAYVVLSAYDFKYAGLTDDNIYDYVMSNGTYANMFYFNDSKGADYVVSDLQPTTEYIILVAGETQFGLSAWTTASAITGEAPAFSLYGTGRYNDFTWMFGGEYQSPVDIWYTENTDPVRYRVWYPYHSYWRDNSNNSEVMENYAGFDSDYFDFYLDGENFVYTSFYNGYQAMYDDWRPIQFQYYAVDNNRIITDGVYNLSPWAALAGTNVGYGFRSLWEYIYLEMPGVEYTPSWKENNGVAAKRSVKSKPSPLVPEGPEHLNVQKVQPFTRHLVKTGKPVVIPARKAVPALSSEEKLVK